MLGNGSGTYLEHQLKRHHRLALVTLPLLMPLPMPLLLDTSLDARCVYALNFLRFYINDLVDRIDFFILNLTTLTFT